ncbi:MAG: DUF669 domain-containing protein [Candidatus Paceibacterota bacterium]
MGKLTDILRAKGKLDTIESAWGTTEAANDYDLLPKGEYLADIVKGDAIESQSKGTPGYRLTFEVVEGEHAGARFWHEVWFTEAALSRTKRDLAKLGVTDLAQLEKPLPAVFRCCVKLTIRRDDDFESNRVRKFDVVDVIRPEPDAFAPEPSTDAPGSVDRDDDDSAAQGESF